MPLIFIFFLFGCGGTLFGLDQQAKRKKDQTDFLGILSKLEQLIAYKEAEMEKMRRLFPQKDSQIKILLGEIEYLRDQLSAHRSAA